MKKQILFIHSAGPQEEGEGSSGLVSCLLNVLNNEYEIRHPLMPQPENPRYEGWKLKMKQELTNAKSDLILIGHSLGASIILKYLSEESYSNHINGLFLISTPYWGEKGGEMDEYALNKNFGSKLKNISPICFYHSKEDNYVPFAHLAYYSKALPQALVRVLNGQEHEFSYGLPQLVEDIHQLS